MIKPFMNCVSLARAEKAYCEMGSCRRGTVRIGMEDFAKIVGDPHNVDFSEEGIDGAGKVHVEWYFETPRGTVDIHDYWWNPKDVLSIGAPNYMAMLWMKGWLKSRGIPCDSKIE